MDDSRGVSRRRVLRGLGGATVGVTSAEKADWGELTDLGPDDWEPGIPASANVTTPDTITVDGQEVELRPVTGTCEDFIEAGKNGAGNTSAPADITVTDSQIERVGDTWDPGELPWNGDPVRYDITDCTVTPDPDVWILDWRPSYEPTEQCRKAYCENAESRIQHELEHVKDHENFAPKFEQWVANTEFDIVMDPASATNRVERATNALFAKYTEKYNNRDLLNDYAHDRIGSAAVNFCPACADCREVNGKNNWTYADVKTWKLEVLTTVELSHRITFPEDDWNHWWKGVSKSTYDATFYLDQVPPGALARAKGGIASVQDLIGRFEDVTDMVSKGLNPETARDALNRALERREHKDVVNDGQPPLLWFATGNGSIDAEIEMKELESQPPCPDEQGGYTTTEGPTKMSWYKTRVSGTMPKLLQESVKPFVSIIPKQNILKCYWSDLGAEATQGKAMEVKYLDYCPPSDPEDRDEWDGPQRKRTETEFGSRPTPIYVYGGADGVIRHQFERIREGAKDRGGYSQKSLEMATEDPAAADGFTKFLGAPTSGGVGRLLGGVMPDEIRRKILSSVRPFWNIQECQQSTFADHYQGDLYGPDSSRITRRLDAVLERYADSNMVKLGSEDIVVALTAMDIENRNSHRLNCSDQWS